MTASGETRDESTARNEFALERYRYILQQIHAVNESAHRFLALYQTLATTLVGAALALFVGYHKWDLEPSVARGGIIGLLTLTTVVAAFTAMLIVAGVFTWLDYRNEECDITDEMVGPGFRKRPRLTNFWRWHETYVLLFIILSMAIMWILAGFFLLPAMT
jgi:ABC-type dipeptide/oligopeptide/nickel transport system permease component